jgi:hypothetical protein
MNKSQIIGIGIGIVGIMAYFLTENGVIHTISGALCAVSLDFIFKYIPFKRKNISE